MRIAYLMLYTGNNFDEIAKTIDYLISKDDDVYIMVNDDDTRDNLFLAFADDPCMHISNHQQVALPADLSLPRGYLYQIVDALEYEREYEVHYDYFITLSDGMLPLVSKGALDTYLEKLEGKDVFYIASNTDNDEKLLKRVQEYSFFTNSYDFQSSKMIRGMNSLTSGIVKGFKKRKLEDTIYSTYPWFIISHESAEKLAKNMYYCSNTFKMCLYPEELAIGTMLMKYAPDNHINENIWVAGPDGDYKFMTPVEEVTKSVLEKYPNALFASKFIASDKEDERTLYDDIVEIYNPENDYD